MGKKRKTFRRVKVSNCGYVSGKRLQMFGAYEQRRQTSEGLDAGGQKRADAEELGQTPRRLGF